MGFFICAYAGAEVTHVAQVYRRRGLIIRAERHIYTIALAGITVLITCVISERIITSHATRATALVAIC